MKRIFALVACAVLTIFTLASCGEKYEPVKSTKEESRVIYTMTVDGEEYEVKYELYRMIFLSNKALIDGGDDSVWTSDNKDEYIKRMDKLVYERSAEIFAVFAYAKQLGINPYSVAVDDKIYEYIVLSVEGNQADVQGHGTYEKFLESLKERYMNYSVMELMLRYSIVSSMIYEKYNGVADAVLGEMPGEIEIKREDVLEYYFSDECARVLQIYSDDYDKMLTHKEKIAEKDGSLGVALYIIQNSTVVHTDCIVDKKPSGTVIGKYAVDRYAYGEYADAVFALKIGGVSDVIEVDDAGVSYYVAYKLQKTDEHFERCYDSVKQSYVNNSVGKMLVSVKSDLVSSLSKYDGYSSINHAQISMN